MLAAACAVFGSSSPLIGGTVARRMTTERVGFDVTASSRPPSAEPSFDGRGASCSVARPCRS